MKNITGFSTFKDYPFKDTMRIHYQSPSSLLLEQAVHNCEGVYNDTGALCVFTGEFTGRSPKDRFIVKEKSTAGVINWNEINQPIEEYYFFRLKKKMLDYLNDREDIWIRDAYACADERFRLNIRVINENPWSGLFVHNMFLRPSDKELQSFEPEWHIIHASGFKADPDKDGTRRSNFVIISFKEKTILIGGTSYTGEIKKGIFTVLNFILPYEKNVLSMHCSANMGSKGDVALFFGLSGTGKTTLSADPERRLIGDDEHGWSNNGVFNFEGGCYAKCIGLKEEKEPEIFKAIRQGALAENVCFFPGTNNIDFENASITENTRVSYPLHYIPNALTPSIGGIPVNIFFLTCDAYGIFPPISKLTVEQAMYYFISGYTAKIAGTEQGVTTPKATFSACFGAPFLPLHPLRYGQMLGEKIRKYHVNVWLINTGWTGGGYGTGCRISLSYTRSIVKAALNNELQAGYEEHPILKIKMPLSCPGVPSLILNPRNTWQDKKLYDQTATALQEQLKTNFSKYKAET